ncbi:hypothetical protein ACVWXU_004467 [Streptomyces sp. TE33382]
MRGRRWGGGDAGALQDHVHASPDEPAATAEWPNPLTQPAGPAGRHSLHRSHGVRWKPQDALSAVSDP